ncbi:MAG: family 43 glycosylhydrolase [Bacteroidales bacterium]|nr:family 43 glycosylhydrolase [Bacteroidales bacterium]
MMKIQVVPTLISIFIISSCLHKKNDTSTNDHEIHAQGVLRGVDLDDVKKELVGVVFTYDTVLGIGHEPGCTRRDPSDVIKVGDTLYVWYTKIYGRSPGYWGSIWYATSRDEGNTWQENGEALGIGLDGSFDSQATFTPNILYADGKYYLFYTGVRPTPGRTDGVFENNSTNDITAIGVAMSTSPDGPFERLHGGEPALQISIEKNDFDSYRIDDAVLLVRDGKYWLYYKGRSQQHGPDGPGKTKMGVAFSGSPEGLYAKFENNPILDKSHEVMIWKQGQGVACLASLSSTFEYAHDGLDFTTANLNIKIPGEERPKAPGTFRPELIEPETENAGLTWGISMVHNGDEAYLVRWKTVKGK